MPGPIGSGLMAGPRRVGPASAHGIATGPAGPRNDTSERGGILLLVLILLLFLEVGIAAAFASALEGLRDARRYAVALRAEGATEEALADVIAGWDPLLNYGVTFPPGSVRQMGPWPLSGGASARAEIRRDARDLYAATIIATVAVSGDTARRTLTVLLRLPVAGSLLAGPDTASPPILDSLRPAELEHRARWPFQ